MYKQISDFLLNLRLNFALMKIEKAIFCSSCTKLDGRPSKRLPEFAFIGRSNVGKSSLINLLCKGAHKESKGGELARTSSSPGKTIAINHFLINDKWYLVDLPGYGFAKLGQKQRQSLSTMNNEYLSKSEELANLFVLIDSRHSLQTIDLEFLKNVGKAGIPFAIIFTKADKLGKNALSKSIDSIKKEILNYWEELPPCFISSAENGLGKDEIISYIGEVLNIIKSKK